MTTDPDEIKSTAGVHPDDPGHWILRLYVAGQTPKSLAALANLRRLCDEQLDERYKVEVIDVMENPRLAREHQILAIPTLVRSLPVPIKKIIGDLSNMERVMVSFELQLREKNR